MNPCELIVSCGMPDARMVSLNQLVPRPVTLESVRKAVVRSFAEVFAVDLEPGSSGTNHGMKPHTESLSNEGGAGLTFARDLPSKGAVLQIDGMAGRACQCPNLPAAMCRVTPSSLGLSHNGDSELESEHGHSF